MSVIGNRPQQLWPRFLPLVILGLAMEVVWLVVLGLGDLRPVMTEFQILFLLIGLMYLTAVRLLPPAAGLHAWRPWLLIIMVFAAAFRITLLPAAPTLSDDIYRYLWEGRLVLHLENPFDQPPSAEEHQRFRDEHFESVNHPDMTTIYPPAAQALFAASQVLSRHPWSMKLLVTVADLILIAILAALLLARGRHPAWVLIYAWHPLPVVEFSGSGHLDAAAILWLFAALLWLERQRPVGALLALAVSGLSKLFAFAAIPLFARRFGWRRSLVIVVPFSVAALLPFVGAGEGLFRSLGAYAASWSFNGSIFDLVVWLTGSPLAARVLAVVVFAAAALVLPRWRDDAVWVVFVLVALFALLSPTLHPWYLTWVIPFLCFFPRLSWMYLTLAVILAYHAVAVMSATGVWFEAPWVRAVEYGPFAVLLVYELLVGRRRRESW